MIAKQESLGSYARYFVRRYWLYLASLSCIAVFAGIFMITVNYQIKEIIDAIVGGRIDGLGWLLLLFAFYKLMYHGVFFITRLLDIHYKPVILEQTITDIYRMVMGHSLFWFDSHLSGEISSKIADFEKSITALITFVFRAAINLIVIVLSLIYLLRVHIQPAIVLGIFVIIYMPLLYYLLKKQMGLQQKFINARQQTVGIINDSISNIFGIKIIGSVENEFALKFAPSLRRWRFWDRKTRHFDAWWVDNVDTVFITVMSVIQIFLLSRLFIDGAISAGGFAFIAMVTLNIHGELDKFLDSLLFSINPAIAQARSSFSFIAKPYDVVNAPDAKELNTDRAAIAYEDVVFSYGDSDAQILQRFNLRVAAGERLGIVGTSGAGKTTLVKCLLRYFDVQSGRICIDGQDIAGVTQESLRQHISIIPQDITMFHRTIRENLRLARMDASDAEIIDACKRAEIHDDILAMTKGYDSVVGERGVKVSGGQRQRIAIARAILKNAPILILDEATSSLDTPTETLIQKSINELLETSKATVIAIAHRLSTLKHMDRIIVLDSGRIIEEGKHDTLIEKSEGAYKRLWDMQMI